MFDPPFRDAIAVAIHSKEQFEFHLLRYRLLSRVVVHYGDITSVELSPHRPTKPIRSARPSRQMEAQLRAEAIRMIEMLEHQSRLGQVGNRGMTTDGRY
jgi:hypothetical protein